MELQIWFGVNVEIILCEHGRYTYMRISAIYVYRVADLYNLREQPAANSQCRSHQKYIVVANLIWLINIYILI